MNMTKEQLLIDLYRAYRDARKHKRNKSSQLRFELDLEENLVSLRDELFELRYKHSKAKCFVVSDPVKREIFSSSFRDRVVYHLLYNYIAPFFDRRLIYDSYSCRVGKGTSLGVSRFIYHIKSCSENYTREAYVLKMDVKGYFMHIDKNLLYDIVEKSLDECTDGIDISFAKYLVREIIFWNPMSDYVFGSPRKCWDGLPVSRRLTCAPDGFGLPIGDLTSQLFSNIYMDVFDQWIKRNLKLKHYGRYVDDFFIVHTDREYLASLVPRISSFLKKRLGLDVNPNKTVLQSVKYGISFLGTYVMPFRNLPSKRIIHSFKAFIHSANSRCKRSDFNLKEALWLLPRLNSRFGYMMNFSSFRLRFTELIRAQGIRDFFSFDMSLASCRVKALMKRGRQFPDAVNYMYYSEYCNYIIRAEGPSGEINRELHH